MFVEPAINRFSRKILYASFAIGFPPFTVLQSQDLLSRRPNTPSARPDPLAFHASGSRLCGPCPSHRRVPPRVQSGAYSAQRVKLLFFPRHSALLEPRRSPE